MSNLRIAEPWERRHLAGVHHRKDEENYAGKMPALPGFGMS